MITYMAVRTNEDGCKGEAFYYGKTIKSIESRKRQHEQAALNGSNTIFHCALRKYGFNSFKWVVLNNHLEKQDMAKKEINWIRLSEECGHRLYNMTRGGDGGARKNQNMPSPSSETREKISDGLQRYYATHPGTMTGMVGSMCPFYGKSHSEETREKISEKHKRLDKSHLKGAKNPSSRPIICITTGEVFKTASEASLQYQTDLSSIIKCCRGKKNSAGGKTYSYALGAFGWVAL